MNILKIGTQIKNESGETRTITRVYVMISKTEPPRIMIEFDGHYSSYGWNEIARGWKSEKIEIINQDW